MTRCGAQKQPHRDGSVVLTLYVRGHANYAENGKDIVCSAVSCLCISLANTLLALGVDRKCFHMEDGGFYMSAPITENVKYAEGAFDTAVNGLQMIAEQYPSFVVFESGVSHQKNSCDTITRKR